MEAHVFNNFFLRWDFTFQVTRAIKLPISARDRHVLVARFSKKTVCYYVYNNTCCGNKKVIKKNNYTDQQKSRPIYRSTIGRPSADQLLTDTSVKNRPTIGEVSAKSRRSVGEVSVYEKLYRPRYIWNDYRPTINRVSTECRSTIDRYINRLTGRHYLQ